MPYIGTSPSSGLAGADLNGQSLILDADADTHITADTDDQIDISIAGADDFQFTANTFTAQSGSTIAAQAVTATAVTSSGVVLGPAGSVSAPTFSFSGDPNSGMYSIGADELGIAVGGSTPIHSTNRKVYINESADANTTSGLVINQTSYDDQIFALKSSDVAHGLTDVAETDTYFSIMKNSGTAGGAFIQGFGEGTRGLDLTGHAVTENSARSTSAESTIRTAVYKKSGTDRAALAGDKNIFCITNAFSTQFLMTSSGDIHVDGSTSVTSYDEYEDAHLTRALDLTHGRGVVDSKFDEFITYNHEKLAEMKLVGREEDGTPNHFINVTGLQRLHNGAIWQQYEKHENLLNAVYELAVEAVGEDRANEILDKNEIKLLSKNKLLN